MPRLKNFYAHGLEKKPSHNAPAKPQKSGGLSYLHSENVNYLNQAITLYNNACYFGLELQGKHIKNFREAYDKAIATNNNTALKEINADLRQVNHLVFNFYQYERCNQVLTNPELWAAWTSQITNPMDKAKLRYLRDKWQKHGAFSHYSPDALLFAADILANLEAHILVVIKEIEKNAGRIPANAYESYSNYLANTLQQIKTEKQMLCWAMYARLELACSSGDRRYDDVTFALMENLQSLPIDLQKGCGPYLIFIDAEGDKVTSASFDGHRKPYTDLYLIDKQAQLYYIPIRNGDMIERELLKDRDQAGMPTTQYLRKQYLHLPNNTLQNLTAEDSQWITANTGHLLQKLPRLRTPSSKIHSKAVTQFYQYIAEQGVDSNGHDLSVKQALNTLSWFNKDNSLTLSSVRSESGLFFIPESMKKLVPAHPRKPIWLFTGHNRRFHYFQPQTEFLLALASGNHLNIHANTLDELVKHPGWTKLEEQKAIIKQKADEAQEHIHLRGKRALFKKTTHQFFEQWSIELLTQQQTIIARQIDGLALLVPKSKLLQHETGDKVLFSQENRLHLMRLLDILEREMHQIQQQLTTQINELEKVLAKIQIQSNAGLRLFSRQKQTSTYQQLLNKQATLQKQRDKQQAMLANFQAIENKLMALIEVDIQIDTNTCAKLTAENTLKQLANGNLVSQEALQQIIVCHDELKLNYIESTHFIRDNESNFNKIQGQLVTLLKMNSKELLQPQSSDKITLALQSAELLDQLSFKNHNTALLQAVREFLANYEKFITEQSKEFIEQQRDKLNQGNALIEKVIGLLKDSGISNMVEQQEQLISIQATLNKKISFDTESLAAKACESEADIALRLAEIELQNSQAGLRSSQGPSRRAKNRLKQSQQYIIQNNEFVAEYKTHHQTEIKVIQDKVAAIEAINPLTSEVKTSRSNDEVIVIQPIASQSIQKAEFIKKNTNIISASEVERQNSGEQLAQAKQKREEASTRLKASEEVKQWTYSQLLSNDGLQRKNLDERIQWPTQILAEKGNDSELTAEKLENDSNLNDSSISSLNRETPDLLSEKNTFKKRL